MLTPNAYKGGVNCMHSESVVNQEGGGDQIIAKNAVARFNQMQAIQKSASMASKASNKQLNFMPQQPISCAVSESHDITLRLSNPNLTASQRKTSLMFPSHI
jgi:hypothetical protein